MKHLWIFLAVIFLYAPLQAQHTVIQLGDKKSAASFAEAPQKFMTEIRSLRGFGCFLKVNKSDEQYDNLVGFYEIGKEGENFLIFFIKAEIVNAKGKVVASSNKVKAKLAPGKKAFPGQNFFPGNIFFPKGTYGELPAGNYELRWKAVPAEKELSRMFKMDKPEIRYRFSK
ncbi:MAG: hypothetical protein AAFY71_02325 [Bacteroidota bacterium]